jgi:hypothetical protein
MKTLYILSMSCLLTLQAFSKTVFTDEDLKYVLEKNDQGIIYLWSPFMPLSILGREEIIDVAKKMDIGLTLVVDPLAIETQTPDPLMKSRALMVHGVLDHYPAVSIYSDGKLLEGVIIHGYEPKIPLMKLIQFHLNRRNI